MCLYREFNHDRQGVTATYADPVGPAYDEVIVLSQASWRGGGEGPAAIEVIELSQASGRRREKERAPSVGSMR